MKTHQVIVAGGGPTGMMLAAELTIAKVDVVVLEPRLTPELSGARSGGGGLHTRTIEVLDQRGVAERFLAEGTPLQTLGFNGVRFDISDWPTRHPYGLALWQKHTERIMAAWVDEIGVQMLRGVELTGFTQDDAGVTAELSNGDRLRAQYLVGCDGGRSLVRKIAGIDFPGSEATMSWLIAQAMMRDEPAYGFKHDATGRHAMGKAATEGFIGIVLTETAVRPNSERTLDDLRERLIAVYGTDFGVHDATYISSFTDATRQAAEYRRGRVILAGDAAHVHPPLGGMGLNTGVQDAVNLGWKLAQVMSGVSAESLLDTYQAERHPVAARVLKNTMAHVAAMRLDDRSKAIADYVTEFLTMEGPRKAMAGEMSGLTIRYNFGEGHPLLGRRMPDLDIVTPAGPTRVFTLLSEAKPLLLNFGEPGGLSSDRVRTIDATYGGTWRLPVIGEVPAPIAVLVRPDGYVAWIGDSAESKGLADAIRLWF
jgi:3-(3-hydroxy-phenyl)propionate hydroxylase